MCLALLEDGIPVLGVMGTPNLPVDYKSPKSSGVLFVASRRGGAFQVSNSDMVLAYIVTRRTCSAHLFERYSTTHSHGAPPISV